MVRDTCPITEKLDKSSCHVEGGGVCKNYTDACLQESEGAIKRHRVSQASQGYRQAYTRIV